MVGWGGTGGENSTRRTRLRGEDREWKTSEGFPARGSRRRWPGTLSRDVPGKGRKRVSGSWRSRRSGKDGLGYYCQGDMSSPLLLLAGEAYAKPLKMLAGKKLERKSFEDTGTRGGIRARLLSREGKGARAQMSPMETGPLFH